MPARRRSSDLVLRHLLPKVKTRFPAFFQNCFKERSDYQIVRVVDWYIMLTDCYMVVISYDYDHILLLLYFRFVEMFS